MMASLTILYDDIFLEHKSQQPHPERPERLVAARQGAARHQPSVRHVAAKDAEDDQLARIHSPDYLESLGQAAGRTGHFDADTYYSPQSIAAARRAAGAAVTAVDSVLQKETHAAMALVRPPGHHARPGSAMGFCLLNNVAIAAAHALSSGLRRVAVVDWDVHHGNGTQEAFYDRPEVLFVSLHQSPFYPGTGSAAESGADEGGGYTLNIPLSAGADEAVYRAALERIVAPIIEQYAPDLLLISAGFDAHERDPLGGMALGSIGYELMTRALQAASPQSPVVSVLEGGYDLTALEESTAAVAGALLNPSAPLPGATVAQDPLASYHERDLQRAEAEAAKFWKLS